MMSEVKEFIEGEVFKQTRKSEQAQTELAHKFVEELRKFKEAYKANDFANKKGNKLAEDALTLAENNGEKIAKLTSLLEGGLDRQSNMDIKVIKHMAESNARLEGLKDRLDRSEGVEDNKKLARYGVTYERVLTIVSILLLGLVLLALQRWGLTDDNIQRVIELSSGGQ